MNDIASSIFQWLNQHPHMAGLATFIISAAESVAIIGTVVPGSIMMTAIGTLAGAGIIPLYSTICWAIAGAVAGDGISYWLGRHFNTQLPTLWPFRKYPGILRNGELFFRKHGGKSVFIGRFVGPVRAIVPLVAGMMGMSPLRFTIANVLSAIGWAPAYMLPGILLGAASLELPADIAVHAIITLLLTGLLILFCLWLLFSLFRIAQEQIEQCLNRFWRTLSNSKKFHVLTGMLQHHDPRKTHGQLTLAFYFLVTTFIFSLLAGVVFFRGSSTLLINHVVFYLLRSCRTPVLDNIFVAVSLMGEKKVILPSLFAVSIWFFWCRHWRAAAHFFILILCSAVSITFFKHLVHSVRPWGVLQNPAEFSFPSGHTTLATVFYISVTLLIIDLFQLKSVKLLSWLTACIILSIGFSRLYLGAHWTTDVIGGIVLGIMLLTGTLISWKRKKTTIGKPISTLIVLFCTFLLTLSFTFYSDFQKQKKQSTQIPWPTKMIKESDWWDHHTIKPLYRINRFGLARQILNIQWQGSLEDIKKILLKNNWQEAPDATWIDVLYRLSNTESALHLPLIQPLYKDQKPALTLIRYYQKEKKTLLLLRLWQSEFLIRDATTPLWVGTIEIAPSTFSWLSRNFKSTLILTPKLLLPSSSSKVEIKKTEVYLSHRYEPRTRSILILRPKKIRSS